jgi:hypothetical protein
MVMPPRCHVVQCDEMHPCHALTTVRP